MNLFLRGVGGTVEECLNGPPSEGERTFSRVRYGVEDMEGECPLEPIDRLRDGNGIRPEETERETMDMDLLAGVLLTDTDGIARDFSA